MGMRFGSLSHPEGRSPILYLNSSSDFEATALPLFLAVPYHDAVSLSSTTAIHCWCGEQSCATRIPHFTTLSYPFQTSSMAENEKIDFSKVELGEIDFGDLPSGSSGDEDDEEEHDSDTEDTTQDNDDEDNENNPKGNDRDVTPGKNTTTNTQRQRTTPAAASRSTSQPTFEKLSMQPRGPPPQYSNSRVGDMPVLTYHCGSIKYNGCDIVELKLGEPLRCKNCGSRMLYKTRTKRLCQHDGR